MLTSADGRKNPDPVVIMQHPIISFMMVINHVKEAEVRVYLQNPAQFTDRDAFRDLKVKSRFTEAGELGIVAF